MFDFDIYRNWQQRAKVVGLNMSQLCRMAKADRKTIERLKENIPKSLQNYLTIENILKGFESEAEPQQQG